ncbi:RNA-directed DNA polymerase, eukaryota [Tanacetum coccineum]|uniref:RNA-directed DNA polymerase, eukaryota n=1 Tax=Tanacetum coccineum TaxID=301880 RepID=A0ABQ5J7B9_9ASTR
MIVDGGKQLSLRSTSSSRVFEEVEKSDINIQSDGRVIRDIRKEGGSILDIFDEMIKVGQTMGFTMDGCTKDMEKIIGSNGETKKESFSDLEVKYFWGNYQFDHIVSEALGYSGGILCVWDSNVFHKKHHIISDNFVALYGTWIPRKIQLLIISVYAPQSYASKCQLWDFIASLINQWNGECMVMGDFNEVRCKEDRWGSTFLAQGACSFNSFISNAGLNEVQLEGYSFTWAHPSASKMSKLDRFFVTDGFLSLFPHISAVCLDRHLSDHRPILLREMLVDFGATPFRLYHSWLSIPGFDQMITSTWNSFILVDSNGMIRFKKKLQLLKKEIRKWVAEYKNIQSNSIRDVKNKLSDIDKLLDQGGVTDDVLLSRMEAMKQLQELNSSVNCDFVQKAKVRWAIEGDENSKFFHGIINRKRANLSVKGIMIEGEWVDDPIRVKDEFRNHFADRFNDPGTRHGRINFSFPNRLTFEQVSDLEASVSDEEIRKAVWGCGENKSPGPDGFTFEFFRKFWTVVGPDFCIAVKWFFEHGFFATGCNSSFVTLIPKTLDPKLVSEFRPISLIGSLYKVVTKILATRLSFVISDLISNVQTAFLPNRQILDGPFIINEILARCKHKNQQAMFFKVDFAKAYDSIRWDYLDDVLNAFGFGSRWRSWIQGSLNSGKASVLVNGSPTSEFQFHRGLKQGDPLAPFLFILIMESLHLSFNRAVEAGIFTGLRIDDALTISHLFYADDAIFIGDWSKENLKGILNILNCFSLLSGMSINLKKSHILGLGICGSIVSEAAASLGCSVMKTPFNYLGIMVGGNMSLVKSWDETVHKLTKRLSKWKLKTLSIGGRLTLLKSVLGSTPIYNMSIFKVPKTVLNKMENLRRNFFNGIQEGDRKITWVKWHTVLAAKKFGGLGVSSFFALNRGLLAKWVWRFLSQDNSLWCQLISAIHGSNITDLSTAYPSTWNSIIKEFNYLKVQGVDVFSHCKIRIGNGLHTRFWKDLWIGDCTLSGLFPRLFALDTEKDISVAGKLQSPLVSSFRRNVRGGIEEQQLEHLVALLDSVILSNSNDRWVSDLNGDGVFRVKDVRNLLDEFFLPRADIPTRWVKNIPIKVNIFAWKLALDRLPTRANLVQRNVVTESQSCPLCDAILEDTSHLFFNCSLARDVTRLLCRWWNLGVQSFSSYAEWLVWFNSVRLASNLKVILEGVFYVTWWSLWNFRNQLLFASKKPRKESIFDDIVLRSFCWCKARATSSKAIGGNKYSRLLSGLKAHTKKKAKTTDPTMASEYERYVDSDFVTHLHPKEFASFDVFRDVHVLQQNEAIPLSDEEIALDASSEGTMSPGGPRYDYKGAKFGFEVPSEMRKMRRRQRLRNPCLSERDDDDDTERSESIPSVFNDMISTNSSNNSHTSGWTTSDDERMLWMKTMNVLLTFLFIIRLLEIECGSDTPSSLAVSVDDIDITDLEVKYFWGNYQFDHIVSEALGKNSIIIISVYASSSYALNVNYGISFCFSYQSVEWALYGDGDYNEVKMKLNATVTGIKLRRLIVDIVQKGEREWVDDPIRVKDEFRNHFADRFNDPGTRHGRINFSFPNRLTFEQVSDLEASVSDEEIRKAVWGCGENKSPGMSINLKKSHIPQRIGDSWSIVSEAAVSPWMFRLLNGGEMGLTVFALDTEKDISVADRWVSDLNGDGVFRVKDVRNLLDEFFLPRADVPTRCDEIIMSLVKFGSANFFITSGARLQELKKEIRLWRQNTVLNNDALCRELKTKTEHFDVKAELGLLEDAEIEQRLSLLKNLEDLEHLKRLDIMQKAKVK